MGYQSDSPIDLEQLHQISEGDLEFEIEVLEVYVEDLAQRLDSMRTAVLIGDRHQVMAEAHHIKGSSSNVGAVQIRSLVLRIEHLAVTDLNAVLKVIDDIIEALNLVQLFIIDKVSLHNQ